MLTTIDKLARSMADSQSFDFSTFVESRNSINVGGMFCEYDRMTLYLYNHNIPNELWLDFCKIIKDLLNQKLDKEEKKRRDETVSLLLFIECNKQYRDYRIIKCTRPDFIIMKENQRIGIEVTELILPLDKIAYSIRDDIDKHNCSKEELKEIIYKKHGKKAEKYEIYDNNGKLSVMAPLRCVNKSRDCFVNKLIGKYHKYKDDIDNFDDFIILCDERNVVLEISEESELKELVKTAAEANAINGVKISFLYKKNGDSSISCFNVIL